MYKTSISCAKKIVTYIVFRYFLVRQKKKYLLLCCPQHKFFGNFYVDPVLEKKIRKKNSVCICFTLFSMNWKNLNISRGVDVKNYLFPQFL